LISIPSSLLKIIIDEAEAAAPEECCGLLIGRDWAEDELNDGCIVTRIAPSPNVTEDDPKASFEIDPKLRFDLMRDIKGTNKRIIGVYHSHPNKPAQPSKRDLAQAWEPNLTWLIVSVINGQATHTSAHALSKDNSRFDEIRLRTTDWKPYPQREST
jgi:proteasome lid subunit RPN8/RPN11